ncbi:MAG: DUF998 domain-containing protein [Anaerolineae bacterium]|nr:MAG: DUF998 domain-containing protein [Anaerolineae bacterium]
MKKITGAAWVSILCALLAAGLVVALHQLDPQYLPERHNLDQYMLGSYGWMMRAAFFLLAAAVAGLSYSLIVETPGDSKLGAFLLLLAGFGFLFAGLFSPGPGGVATLLVEQVHAGSLGMARATAALGAQMVAWRARRGQAGWLNLLLAVVLAAAWFWLRAAPDGLAGWQDRAFAAALIVWLLSSNLANEVSK